MSAGPLLELFACYLIALSMAVLSLVIAHRPPSAPIARERLLALSGRGSEVKKEISMYDKWFKDLKTGNLAWYSLAAGYAMYQNQLGMGAHQKVALTAAVVAGVVAAGLYFINPKDRDWLPTDDTLEGLIRQVVASQVAPARPTVTATLSTDPTAAKIAALEAQLMALRGGQ